VNQYKIDATNQSLGRLASRAAQILRGKNVPTYDPGKMPTNEVLIENLKKAKFTGKKMKQKVYYHYSGYHSGIKARKLSELWESRPEKVFKDMILRMLPVNKLRKNIIKNLKFR
jgi:large subunit ribosomal protein L13